MTERAHGRRRTIVATAVVLTLFLVFAVSNRSELRGARHALQSAPPAGLALLAGLSLLWLANLAGLHSTSQRLAGVRIPAGRVLLAAPSANALNLVAKSGGMAGVTVLRREAERSGASRGAGTAGYVITTVVGELGFAAVLVAAIAIALVDGHLTGVEIIAAVVFGVYAGARVLVVVTALRNQERLRRLYALPARALARVRRRTPPSPTATDASADELYHALADVRAKPAAASRLTLHGLGVEVIGTVMLFTALHVVGANAGWSTALVAYAFSVLFAIVSVLPAGLGFVELGLGAVLVSSGVPTAEATAAIVVFRVAELWLPLGLGGLALHQLRRRP